MGSFASGLTLEEIECETGKLASELAFYAKRPVKIECVGGQHIAFTYDTDKDKKAIPVVMNPAILAKIRNKRRALQIWRGIGFHELCHHLWPAGAQYKAAHKEGFRHLFNLIDDEQNERRGAALNKSWGSCFQSVCSYIFSSQERCEVATGIADGGVSEKPPTGVAADRIYAQRWNKFAFHFRRHIPIQENQDPAVLEALALVPANFKDLSKEELLELTRAVHEKLCSGIQVPASEQGDDVSQPEDAEEESDQPEDSPSATPSDTLPEDAGEVAPTKLPMSTWQIKRLLKGRLMIAVFAVFVLGWALVFAQAGASFWVQVAFSASLLILTLVIFLFIRRELIKSTLRDIKAKLSGGSSSGTEKGVTLADICKNFVFLPVIASLVVLLLCWLIHHFRIPLTLVILCAAVLFTLALICAGNLLSARAERQHKPLSPWILALFLTVAASSLALLFWAAISAGFAMLWIKCAVYMLSVTVLMIFMMMHGSGKTSYRQSSRERLQRGAGSLLGKPLSAVVALVWRKAIEPLVARPVLFIARFLWSNILSSALFSKRCAVQCYSSVARNVRRTYWRIAPILTRLWRKSSFRLFVIAAPVSAIAVIIYSLLVQAAAVSWWIMALLFVFLLAALILIFVFRKQISRFILAELFIPMPSLVVVSGQPPLDMSTDWYIQIDNVVEVEPDHALVEELLPETYALAIQLRKHLRECGSGLYDKDDQSDGHDLIDEVELALVGETNIFVEEERRLKASVHIEVGLDCSSSMSSPTATLAPGQKFRLGKLFAMVLEQAVINLPGVSAHFWGFTDDTIYDCGVAGERRVSGLVCGGGNNDAAMLFKMAQSARTSAKEITILLMLSDGQPSECSWLALHNLVVQFEQEGMIPWNFALDAIDTPAFERFFTDLVGQTQDEAVMTMGQILASIAQSRFR